LFVAVTADWRAELSVFKLACNVLSLAKRVAASASTLFCKVVSAPFARETSDA